jgi:UDP-glucuronate decarboxylase
MRILVTGGAGFIGNHLCRRLLKDGHYVVCVDNLYSGHVKNIEDMKDNDRFIFLKVDIVSDEFIDLLSEMDEADAIYHLACPASPKFYQLFPLLTIETCIKGTTNVLDYAVYVKAKVLFTSAAEVYGESFEHPQTEEYRGNVNTLGIHACYNEGKRLAETIIMEYNRLYNMDVKIVRIFNTYGPGMEGMIITNFIKQALSNKPLTIYGDGSHTMSLCYIDDMVDGLVKMMKSEEKGPINLGNPDEISIKNLANLVIELTSSKSKTLNYYLPCDNTSRVCPVITKARELLGWDPEVVLSVGLLMMLEAF